MPLAQKPSTLPSAKGFSGYYAEVATGDPCALLGWARMMIPCLVRIDAGVQEEAPQTHGHPRCRADAYIAQTPQDRLGRKT